MSQAFSSWWSNPVTVLLVGLFAWSLLVLMVSGFAAVLRIGSIQLTGVLAQRPKLLPGVPRQGGVFAAVIVVLLILAGLCLVLFALAVVRLQAVTDLPVSFEAGLLTVGWIGAAGLGFLTARGNRAEPLATVVLVTLRPLARFVGWLLDGEPVQQEDDEEDEDDVDEHEVRAFIGAGEEAGILEREEAELIAHIVEFSGTVAREIMTPRTDVVALPVDADFDAVRSSFVNSMFTRIPVFRESLDRIEGMLHVKDVLKALAAGETPAAGRLVHPVLMVPETKPLLQLLREFQAGRQQLAVVVDEYGGTSGIVTLEDVLEEIVGEIQDEHQSEPPDVEPQEEGAYLVSGGANLEVLRTLFGVEIGEMEFDSVAGLVLDRIGHVPRPGETVTWHGIELEVLEVERRRVRRIRVRRLPGAVS